MNLTAIYIKDLQVNRFLPEAIGSSLDDIWYHCTFFLSGKLWVLVHLVLEILCVKFNGEGKARRGGGMAHPFRSYNLTLNIRLSWNKVHKWQSKKQRSVTGADVDWMFKTFFLLLLNKSGPETEDQHGSWVAWLKNPILWRCLVELNFLINHQT